jgi:hypothetical protein
MNLGISNDHQAQSPLTNSQLSANRVESVWFVRMVARGYQAESCGTPHTVVDESSVRMNRNATRIIQPRMVGR